MILSVVRRQAFRPIANLRRSFLQTSLPTITSLGCCTNSNTTTSITAQRPALSAARLFSIDSSRQSFATEAAVPTPETDVPAQEAAAPAQQEPGDVVLETPQYAPLSAGVVLETFTDVAKSQSIYKKVMKTVLKDSDFEFDKMTEVEAKTLYENVKGTDVFAQAPAPEVAAPAPEAAVPAPEAAVPAPEALAQQEPGDPVLETPNFVPLSADVVLETFADLAKSQAIDKRIMQAILNDFKFDKMTEVQAKTLYETLKGIDVFVQAKNGTGKTLAYLLPVLQRMLNSPNQIHTPAGDGSSKVPIDIRSLIITSHQALARRIAKDCEKLTKYIPGFRVQIAIGGAKKEQDLRRLHKNGCNILVATPGRLSDLLVKYDPESGVRTPNLEMLVIDEAGNLLNEGFSEHMKAIMEVLPPKDTRQTMLFSATLPDKIQEMIPFSLKPTYKVLKFVSEDGVPTHP